MQNIFMKNASVKIQYHSFCCIRLKLLPLPNRNKFPLNTRLSKMKIEVYRKASTKETSGRFPLSITKNHSLLPKIR